MKKVILTPEAIKKLAGYAVEITEYDNADYHYTVAFFEDGSVSKSDVLNSQSYAVWRESPVATLTVEPIYTSADVSADIEAGVKDAAELWSASAKATAECWAENIAYELAQGVDEDWYPPRCYIEW